MIALFKAPHTLSTFKAAWSHFQLQIADVKVTAGYHGDQVSEPLVGKFVSDHQRHPLPGGRAGVLRVDQQCGLSGKQQKVGVNAETAEGRHFLSTPAGFSSIKHSEATSAAGLFIKKSCVQVAVDGRWTEPAAVC